MTQHSMLTGYLDLAQNPLLVMSVCCQKETYRKETLYPQMNVNKNKNIVRE